MIYRFKSGGGVTQPSQIRYVEYFGEILQGYLHKEVRISPLIVKLEKLVMHGMPRISAGYFRPYVEIYSVRNRFLQHTTKVADKKPQKYTDENGGNVIVEIPFHSKNPLIMTGDILVKVYHMSMLTSKLSSNFSGTLDSKLAFRFGFNTAFLEKDNEEKA